MLEAICDWLTQQPGVGELAFSRVGMFRGKDASGIEWDGCLTPSGHICLVTVLKPHQVARIDLTSLTFDTDLLAFFTDPAAQQAIKNTSLPPGYAGISLWYGTHES